MADPGVRRPASEAGVGQDHWGVGTLAAILSVMNCGSGGPEPRDGLYDKKAGVESQALSPGLDLSL